MRRWGSVQGPSGAPLCFAGSPATSCQGGGVGGGDYGRIVMTHPSRDLSLRRSIIKSARGLMFILLAEPLPTARAHPGRASIHSFTHAFVPVPCTVGAETKARALVMPERRGG